MKPPVPRPKEFPQNLVLIGMFGSGKSTIGRILAAKLRYHFVDVDQLIEAKFKKPLQKVLDDLGMKGFMKMEDETLQALRNWHCVLSPGGSAVYYPKGMKHLRKLGPRIFLKVELDELKKRLPDWSNRGVVCRGGTSLSALYKERSPLFRKYADFTVETYGKSAEKIAQEILAVLGLPVKSKEKKLKIKKAYQPR
jgi:shikimate kinase